MSALGAKADIQCPLFEPDVFLHLRMSAFGGKADVRGTVPKSPLIAKSGHSAEAPIHAAKYASAMRESNSRPFGLSPDFGVGAPEFM